VSRTLTSVARRLRTGVRYPGLAEMLDGFYRAIVQGGAAPVSPEHLVRVTGLFEILADRIRAAASAASVSAAPVSPRPETGPLVVVTERVAFSAGMSRERSIASGVSVACRTSTIPTCTNGWPRIWGTACLQRR